MISYINKNPLSEEITAFGSSKIKHDDLPKIQAPETADTPYRGSNPEYLLYLPEDTLSFEKYQRALPILKQSFPRGKAVALSAEKEERLNANEMREITSELEKEGFEVLAIPKTLYDLFYTHFFFEDYPKQYFLSKDVLSVSKQHSERVQHFFSNYISGKTAISVSKFYEMGTGTGISDFEKIPRYLDGDGTKLSTDLPVLKFSDSFSADQQFQEREDDLIYQRCSFEFNQRVLEFLRAREIDLKNFSWKQMKGIAESLLTRERVGYVGPFADVKSYTSKRSDEMVITALWHEYQLDPSRYSIYRAGDITKDRLQEGTKLSSLSFSHSPYAGIRYDGKSGCAAGYAHSTSRDCYAVTIKKSDATAREILDIPPAKGLNRGSYKGEIQHARSKIWFDEQTQERDIIGFDGHVGTKKQGSIKADPEAFKTAEAFLQVASQFLAENTVLLVPKN